MLHTLPVAAAVHLASLTMATPVLRAVVPVEMPVQVVRVLPVLEMMVALERLAGRVEVLALPVLELLET